ncbi:MAG: membrane protein insertase YidC [Pseudomonadota bacterium]
MEKRALIAFVISMAIFVMWSYFFSGPSTPPQQPVEKQPGPGEPAAKPGLAPQTPAKPAAAKPGPAQVKPEAKPLERSELRKTARLVAVKTDLYTAVFTEWGGRLKSLTLNNYLAALGPDAPPKEQVVVDSENDLPLGLHFQGGRGPDLDGLLYSAGDKTVTLGREGKASLTMAGQTPDGFEVIRKYTFTRDSYIIGLDITIQNKSGNSLKNSLVLELVSQPLSEKLRYAGFGAWIDRKLLEKTPDDLEKGLSDLKNRNYTLGWAGYQDQYFLAALLPRDKEKTRITAEAYGEKGVRINFINPELSLDPGGQVTYSYGVFYGPKDYNVLKKEGNDLSGSIDFGWFDILSKPLLIFMTWLHRYVGNYGLVIIIVTILIKILFWPLTAKSYKSMKGMQKLQPKIMKLREKYKGDRQKMNQEMMQMYRTYKINPMGGCLPMVIQIPVFIALYRLLDYSLELRHSPLALWIQDLSAPDRLFDFGFKIPLMEPPSGIPVLTLLMGASMLIQQRMTPTPGDPMQAKIMMLMPVFFTFIFINFPAGLVLYWLTNNILSIGQQVLINKRPD